MLSLSFSFGFTPEYMFYPQFGNGGIEAHPGQIMFKTASRRSQDLKLASWTSGLALMNPVLHASGRGEGAVLSEGSQAWTSSAWAGLSQRALSVRDHSKQPASGAQAGIFPIFRLALWHEVQADLCVGGSPWEELQPSEAFSLFTCPGGSQEGTRGDISTSQSSLAWGYLPH